MEIGLKTFLITIGAFFLLIVIFVIVKLLFFTGVSFDTLNSCDIRNAQIDCSDVVYYENQLTYTIINSGSNIISVEGLSFKGTEDIFEGVSCDDIVEGIVLRPGQSAKLTFNCEIEAAELGDVVKGKGIVSYLPVGDVGVPLKVTGSVSFKIDA